MRTFLHTLFCFFMIIGLAASCRSRKPAAPVIMNETKEITHTVRDTVYKVEADSAYYYAWVECRDDKPVLVENSPNGNLPNGKPGKNISAEMKLEGNTLSVKVNQQAQELFKQWRETYIKEQKPAEVPVYRDVPVEKPLTFWQKTMIRLGWITLIEILLFAVYIALKILKKI